MGFVGNRSFHNVPFIGESRVYISNAIEAPHHIARQPNVKAPAPSPVQATCPSFAPREVSDWSPGPLKVVVYVVGTVTVLALTVTAPSEFEPARSRPTTTDPLLTVIVTEARILP